MSLLDKITGQKVLVAGLAGTAISDLLLIHGHIGAKYLILGAAVFSGVLISKKVAATVQKILGKFADSPSWPRFVSLGIALMTTAVVGGRGAAVVAAFLLASMAGNFFTSLY